MNLQVIKNRVLKWLRKIFFYGLYIFVLFSVLGFAVLQIPAVQKTLAQRYIDRFTTASGFKITFKSIYLLWYDRLQIEGLVVNDPEQNAMITADALSVNFRISSLIKKDQINIDAVSLNGAAVNLIKIPETDSSKNLNINIFISRLGGNSGGGGSGQKVNIGEVILEGSKFSYNDTDKDSIRNQFDYNHFSLSLDDGVIQSFKVIGDTIQFDVQSLMAEDQATGFGIKSITTFFRISQSSMEFFNLDLDAGESHIGDSIQFTFKSQAELSDFIDKVNIQATLRNTRINPTDLALFAPGVEAIKQPLYVEGKYSGKVNRFFGNDTRINIGNTFLAGRIEMDGLPEINETFINLRLGRSQVDINDLSFLFPEKFYPRFKPLDKFQIQGNFTGFVNDFVADASFIGPIGRIRSDINLKINEKYIERSTYKGGVELNDFNLGAYFGDTTLFQKVSLQGKVNGKGFTEKTADFVLNGTISSLGLKGYNYSNIATNARFKSQFFNGTLSIQDPNLQLKATGSIDFSEDHELVKVKLQLDTAFLDRIGISKEKLFIKTYADINSSGLKLDSLFGEAYLENSFITYKNELLHLDSIHLISTLDNDVRQLSVQSSLVDVNLRGDYYYSSLFNDLNNLFKELFLTIKNEKVELHNYYALKRKLNQDYDAQFEVKLHDLNPIIKLANLPFSISKETQVSGRFSNGFTSIFSAFTIIDSIEFNGKIFTDNEIEFNGSKIRDSTNVLAMLLVNSGRQTLGPNIHTKDLLVEGIWNKDHIDLEADVDQEGYTNSIRLKSEIDFLQDSTRIKILPSRIKALDEDWLVGEDNYALWVDNEWIIHNLSFKNHAQSIFANGYISHDENKKLDLDIQNLELDLINNFSTEKFKGKLNGTVEASSLLGDPFVQNNLIVSDFTINDFLIGNIKGVNQWNQAKRRFDIDFSVDRLNVRTVELKGYYNPTEKEPLHVNAQLQNANLKIVEPLFRDLFSQMEGTITGGYTVTGTFGNPKINGESNIQHGRLMIDYLKTYYTFNGRVGMEPTQIRLTDFDISDILQNKAKLDGFIAHRNFKDFWLNLNGTFRNFKVLNTTTKDNSLFYGQGYATGDVNILGLSSNLKISSTAKTEKNTRIYIPITDSEEVAKKDFLNFVNFTDTSAIELEEKAIAKRNEASGLTMDLNLDITQDAYAEIIFDIKTGEIIRGRGNGEIKLQLNTKGDFNMFGVLEFTQGAYNFTLYDIINKEFDIKPGSRISWYGDPYEGILDITATYRQLASLLPILSDQSVAASQASDPSTVIDPQLRRKYPAEVELKLEGQMLKPRISFDLFARDLPQNVDLNGRNISLNFEFQAFKAKLDEQELKRQVFSLIVLRRFSPPDAFNTSGTITNSMSEFLSNQLSYWLTQVDQNLEIDLDIGSLDEEAFNTFQLRLSYSFLNGRLRVTRDGTISNQYRATDNISTIAGDWTVDYLLTQDGKLKVKMYSRSNYNQINSQLGTQSAVTTGVSLLHTQNFNEFKDLLRSSHEKRKKVDTEEEESPSLDGGSHN